MPNLIGRIASQGLLAGYGWAKRSPLVRSLLYSDHNAQLFGDLRQHEWMLSCRVRVDTYHAAIQKHVHEGDRVVDLGTGTGVLALFASKKKPRHIDAIDHGEMIELARRLAEDNGVTAISFHRCHSSKFEPAEPADVIIQEQIGDFLLDEDMIRNVCDLRDRVLAPGGRILPSRFALFVEPATVQPGERSAFIWEHRDLHGIDFGAARDWLADASPRFGRVDPFCNADRCPVSALLCAPQPIHAFDLMTVWPDALPKQFSSERRIIRDGVLDGFCLYFEVGFDDEIGFRTGPFDPPTSWRYQLYRVEPTACHAGDLIRLTLDIGEPTDIESWRISHQLIRDQPAS
jgi:type I protein arginine methyltransferase